MKKLMIAAAIVCAAVVSQGAVTKWKATFGTTGKLYDGYNNDGSGTYEKAAVGGATMYLIAVASDTAGVGISQAKLLEAFRGDNFNLADYAVPVTAGANHGDTASSGGMSTGFTATNGDESSGDFTATKNYSFYLATVVTSGDQDYLFIGEAATKAAGASTATVSMSMSPSTTSTKFFGDGEYSAAGWYSAVPEPTSGLLLLLGVAGLALRRRRA